MNARLRTLVLLLAPLATLFTLAIGPAVAADSAPSGEEDGKVSLPEAAHDRVGLIILAACGVFAVGALVNASKQLKGSRPQTDGRIRWR